MIFAAPLFLIGLVAVAIPIAVHLFNFRRYKKVYFSNVERLEQMQSETRRQSTLRQLLIMLARILAIVFLVLAFAQPLIPNKNNPLKSGSNDVSIYIDNSFSMENAGESGTLLDKAKQKAREIIAAYGPSDRFQLLTNDIEGRHFHWLSKDEILLMLDEVEASSATMPLSSIAGKQFDFLHSGDGKNKYAYLISDFQTSIADFGSFPNDSSVVSTFVPLEAAEISNVFIDSLSFNAPVYYRGSAVTADVKLRNEGDENLEKNPVTLYINGRQRALASVDLPARGTTSVDMHFVIDESGLLNGYVELVDYPVTFDDKYFFSLNIRERVNMLVVEGDKDNEFLGRLFGEDSAIAYTSLNVRQMDFSRIDDNDVVLLDELPSMSTGMAQSLHTYVENGGTLVVVVGNNIDEASYNEALALFSAPQLAGRNDSRVAAATVDLSNQLYRNVFDGKTDNMEMPSVTGYYRCSVSAGTLREPIVRLANGDDYISSTPCGSGRLYLITAPLREANTDFVRQALFVPTLYNMALFSVHLTQPAVSLDRIEPVELMNDYGGDAGNVRLTSTEGDFEEIPDIRRIGGKNMMVLHGTVRQAGNYLLTTDGVPVEGVSFNYSRLESEMQFLGGDGLKRVFNDYNLSGCSVIENVDKPLDTYLKERMEGRHLWRWCVALSLLMLLVEILLIRIPMRSNRKKNSQIVS